MATMVEIEQLTKEYSDARARLANLVSELNDEIEAAKRRYIARIRREAELVADLKANLQALIEQSPQLFIKPRTVVFHGIKVGFQKGKGELTWGDAARVVALIKRQFPETWKNFVVVREYPSKAALAKLDATELKKVGVTIARTGDEVVIKPMDSDVEKLVEALLWEGKKDD